MAILHEATLKKQNAPGMNPARRSLA